MARTVKSFHWYFEWESWDYLVKISNWKLLNELTIKIKLTLYSSSYDPFLSVEHSASRFFYWRLLCFLPIVFLSNHFLFSIFFVHFSRILIQLAFVPKTWCKYLLDSILFILIIQLNYSFYIFSLLNGLSKDQKNKFFSIFYWLHFCFQKCLHYYFLNYFNQIHYQSFKRLTIFW